MILVGTSVWIDYFNGIDSGQTQSLDRILSEQTVLVGDIILTEILQGFDSQKEFRLAKRTLDPLDCIHLGGKSLAIKAAINFCFLRSKGVKLRKTVNMLIGTWCFEYEVELLHNDNDFDQIALQLPLQIYSD